MKTSRTTRLFAAALLLAASVSASAVPVTYEFSGTTASLGWSGGGNPFSGNPFSQQGVGSFTFDLDFSDLTYSAPTFQLYQPTSPEFGSFNLSMPTFAEFGDVSSAGSNCDGENSWLRVSDADVGVAGGFSSGPADQFSLGLYCNQQISANVVEQKVLWVELLQWNGALDMVNGLDPAQPLDWTLADRAQITYGYALFDSTCSSCTRSWSLSFDIDSMSRTVSAPEPDTLALLAVGLLVCGVFGRSWVAAPKN